MNPLEVLRYLARLNDDDPRQVATAALDSLSGLADNPEMLYVAIKRLLLAHPRNGLLWMVSNRLLLSWDRRGEARMLRGRIDDDCTIDALRDELLGGTVIFALELDRAYAEVAAKGRDDYASLGRKREQRGAGGSMIYFDSFKSAMQLLGQASPLESSALLLEPWSFSGGCAIIPR